MNKYVSIFLKHYQTTIGGLIVLAMTVMLWLGKITMTEWALGFGTVAGIAGLVMKDPNKTVSKP